MIHKSNSNKQKNRQSGQGFVEFALILPLLLLLVWGIVEFGRLLIIYTEVSNAAREAVRYGVARGVDPLAGPRYLDCQGIRDAGRATTNLAPIQDDNFQIAYDLGGGNVLGICEDQPSNIEFGNRLVVTVTHQVQPLVLFQNAGPFEVQFTTARTIVHQGLPMEEPGGGGGGSDDPPSGNATLTFTLDDPGACQGHFDWTSVDNTDGYYLYQSVPTPTVQVADVTGLRYPDSGSADVANDQVYYVRAYNGFGEGPFSNAVTVSGCIPGPTNFAFHLEQPDPCEGFFDWDSVDGVLGYRLYETTMGLIGEVSGTRYPGGGNLPVANGQEFIVKAFNDTGEGAASAPVAISGCVIAPPLAPTNLTFVLDQATPPCQGHFTWNAVPTAEEYHLYQNGGQIAQINDTRYPTPSGSTNVSNGDGYTVTAYNSVGGESSHSNLVTVGGCQFGAGPVDITFYLHSDPTPPNWHGDAPPPLTMDNTPPAHATLYNYNGTDPSQPGREVSKGGGTPPDETNTDRYLEWRSAPLYQPLSLQSNVTLYLWGKNPQNQTVIATAYLYTYNGEAYALIGQSTYSWPSNTDDWMESQLVLGGMGYTVPANHQLVVWVISGLAKDLQFAYDTTGNNSRIELTGEWQ